MGCLFEKTENKWKRGRDGTFLTVFKQKFDRTGPVGESLVFPMAAS